MTITLSTAMFFNQPFITVKKYQSKLQWKNLHLIHTPYDRTVVLQTSADNITDFAELVSQNNRVQLQYIKFLYVTNVLLVRCFLHIQRTSLESVQTLFS